MILNNKVTKENTDRRPSGRKRGHELKTKSGDKTMLCNLVFPNKSIAGTDWRQR